jgi:hypothetical protein
MMIDKEKLQKLMLDLSSEKGMFTFFGLFLRDEAPDKWDLVVSSPWLENGKIKALGEFVEKLSSAIGKEQLLELSRVVTISADDPALELVIKKVKIKDDITEIHDEDCFGLKIKRAYIFHAKQPQLLPAHAI